MARISIAPQIDRAAARVTHTAPPRPNPLTGIFLERLHAPTLDVAGLDTRDNYPDAAQLALRELKRFSRWPNEILPTLVPYVRMDIKAFSLGLLFGVFSYKRTTVIPDPLARLREIDSSEARIVRALLGDLEDWSDAARPERAAIFLRTLVEARLNGGNTP